MIRPKLNRAQGILDSKQVKYEVYSLAYVDTVTKLLPMLNLTYFDLLNDIGHSLSPGLTGLNGFLNGVHMSNMKSLSRVVSKLYRQDSIYLTSK